MNKNPTANEVIAALGGTNAVARLCKIKPPSVTGWRTNGIPQARLQFLELLRPDVFRAPRRSNSSVQATS